MKIKGWKNVLGFTYMQNLRNKAFIASTIVITVIFILITLSVNFLPGILDSGVADGLAGIFGAGADNKVEKVYILDQSEIPGIDFSALGQVEIVPIDESQLNSTIQAVYGSAEAEVVAQITRGDDGNSFSIITSRPLSEEKINADDCRVINNILNTVVGNANLTSLGVSADRIAQAQAGISTRVTIAGEAPKSEIAVILSGLVPIVFSVILFSLIISYSQLIAQSIATEKTSRVMELLLTSVNPLAVIVGKVAGMCLIMLTQLAILGGATTAVTFATAPFGMIGKLMGTAQSLDIEMQAVGAELGKAFEGLNAGSIIMLVFIFILGFLFYSLFAGLVGASISRAEDLQSAMQPLMLVVMLGFYLAYVPSIFSMNTDGELNIFSYIGLYLPISSPFALPSAIMLGEIGLAQIAVAIVLQVVFVILMVLLVVKVYEHIILHTGDRIKFGSLIKMAGRKN